MMNNEAVSKMRGRIRKHLRGNYNSYVMWFLIFIICISVLYGICLDLDLVEIKEDGYWSLFKKEYLNNLIISPLWILVGFFYSRHASSEASRWQKQKDTLHGYMKNRTEIDVYDVREILQDEYNIDQEWEKAQIVKRQLSDKAKSVDEDDTNLSK